MKIQEKEPGFTLIELMIVVAIIGILAAIAIPNFINYACKSKQVEARHNLKALWHDMITYKELNNTYANSIEQLGFPFKGEPRYLYTIVSVSETNFKIKAISKSPGIRGNGEGDDVWEITESGVPSNENLTNACL